MTTREPLLLDSRRPCEARGKSERKHYTCDKRKHHPSQGHHDPKYGVWWGPVFFCHTEGSPWR